MNDYFAKLFKHIGVEYTFTLIDIGAMQGVSKKWEKILDNVKVIAFEPDQREFLKLKNKNNIKYLNYVLNDKSVDLQFNISKEPGKSSILEPNLEFLSKYENPGRFETVDKVHMPSANVKTLDSLKEDNIISGLDFIKLDTQGSELNILNGGKKSVIPGIIGAQIEVEFIRMYKNQPIFTDIHLFMESLGFSLVDIRRHFWKMKNYTGYRGKGGIIFADFLYFKDIDVFRKELKQCSKEYALSKIYKSIIVSSLYGVFDYSAAVADIAKETGLISEIECSNLKNEIIKHSRRGFCGVLIFPRRLYRLFSFVLQCFKPESDPVWADSDENIANISDV